jgi:hypothetical protein
MQALESGTQLKLDCEICEGEVGRAGVDASECRANGPPELVPD